jgi:hypothetical protein
MYLYALNLRPDVVFYLPLFLLIVFVLSNWLFLVPLRLYQYL